MHLQYLNWVFLAIFIGQAMNLAGYRLLCSKTFCVLFFFLGCLCCTHYYTMSYFRSVFNWFSRFWGLFFELVLYYILASSSFFLASVCLSLCLPVSKFLKIWSLVFPDILHDDSWPWHLLTDEARFLEKKWCPEFGPTGPK